MLTGMTLTEGCATAGGTERYRQRFTALQAAHFRPVQDLWASSIGLGTYLGDADDATDARYAAAIRTALQRGCNVLDTAINYRCQRSERAIGATLQALIAEGGIARDEVLLCTKGGYLPFDGAVPADPARYLARTVINTGLASYEEIVGGCHCLAPAYLDHALRSSLANLRAGAIDIYYLHNPEQQLDEVDRGTVMARLEAAFALLEEHAREERIRWHGIAPWHGLRVNPGAKNFLSLAALATLAQRIGGTSHHFRAVQLPYNLAMPEAWAFKNQEIDWALMSPIDAANRLGLTVMSSASLLQSRLTELPGGLQERIPGLSTSAQRAIQFVRSTPGVTTALVGMKEAAHVEENLAVAGVALMDPADFTAIFTRGKR